jgi:alkylated DNA repair dioxygenase AlkB
MLYSPNFITEQEEEDIVKEIYSRKWNNFNVRRTQSYGYNYIYLIREKEDVEEIPHIFKPILTKINHMFERNFDQLIVNEYKKNQGISGHIDDPVVFGDSIVTISLLSDCFITFKNFNEKIDQFLNRRSLFCFKDKYRYEYLHSIHPETQNKLRLSLTFRQVVK